jgi:subtilisin family serine protease
MAASLGKSFVTADGTHIAWNGTSASSPFTAGVIALMLQKNPMLDAEEVRQILIKTAKKGGSVGAVPNPQWGYGMLDAAAALLATPLPKALPNRVAK